MGRVYRAGNVFVSAGGGGARQVRIGLDGLTAGQAMKLYFDLVGFGAAGSRVAIDDVRFVFDDVRAPVAQPDNVETAEDTPVTFDPRANDSSPSGLPLTIELVSAPAHGTVFVGTDGRRDVHADAGLLRSDSFRTGSVMASRCRLPALVTLNITAVNDAPVAVGASGSTAEDTPLSGHGHGDGRRQRNVDVHGRQRAAHGTLVLTTAGGYTYTPLDYFGGDGFTSSRTTASWTSNVATVSLTVTAVNDAPVVAP